MSNHIHILSPHFDDAVFSLSHLLLNFTGTITLITVFTQECEFKHLKGDYAKYGNLKHRKYEDACAMDQIVKQNRKLKLIPRYFDLPDAMFRSFWENPVNDIKNKLACEQINHIYCPLGIGNHPDHLACYKACGELFPSDKITYYSEYPYNSLKLNMVSFSCGINLRLTWNDIFSYYNHAMYASCPRIVRLYRIITSLFYYFIPYKQRKIANILEKAVNLTLKKKLMLCYSSQIEPIFGICNKNKLDIDSKEYLYTLGDASS